ncbi:hypothetical protein [Niallia circulans]|nr:hypothetical protein [Niallia circulans]MED3839933.1 hypothetical protein [Niallia circulans]MED4241419.1 hypothetical protein [Niallia circulans]MED4248080.1 hypothetical protein [Niallia circulans]
MGREAAKVKKYQPKWVGNQPKQKNISQRGEESAKLQLIEMQKPG